MGYPYMWCQTICDLFYENKTEIKNQILEQRSPRSLDEAEEEEKEDKMEADSEDIESTDDSFNSNDTLNSKNESREFRANNQQAEIKTYYI